MGRRVRLDKVVVVDVESTCWDGPPPQGQTSDIIEIGVCLLNLASCIPGEKHSILVRPASSKVSSFCTELTTLTQGQVEQGVTFGEACEILRKDFLSHRRVFASYGDYDRKMFERQCDLYKVPYPFGPRHLNVKTLASLAFRSPQELSMPEALQWCGMDLDGTHHRGDDDARNIARILAEVLQ